MLNLNFSQQNLPIFIVFWHPAPAPYRASERVERLPRLHTFLEAQLHSIASWQKTCNPELRMIYLKHPETIVRVVKINGGPQI